MIHLCLSTGPWTCPEETKEPGCSHSDFLFLRRARSAHHWGGAVPSASCLKRTSSNQLLLSHPFLGLTWRVTSSERPSWTTSSKKHSPATPLCHSLSATLLGFSSKFLAHITYGHRFSVSFHNSISNRTGIFVSFVFSYNPDFWNSAW